MKVVVRTDEYTIYQKRNERYAVRGEGRAWINGDDKVRILLEHKLIEVAEPKAPEPEEAAAEEGAEETEASAEEGAEAAEEASDAGEPEAEAAAEEAEEGGDAEAADEEEDK